MATIRAAPAMRAPWITLSPTPPHPITATVSPGFDLRDMEHRAEAGDHGTAEERRQFDRHVARYRDHAPLVHQHTLGEPTDPAPSR